MHRTRIRWIPVALLMTVTTLFLIALFSLLPLRGWAQTTGATWGNFSPQGWIAATPFTVSVTVTDPGGLRADGVAYSLSQDGGISWTGWLTDHVVVNQPLTTTLVITVSQVNMPDGGSTNRIRFRAYETPTTPIESPAFLLLVDTLPPTVTVTSPAPSEVAESLTLAGSADDATSGVMEVSITLQNDGGLYWNGSDWQPAPAWLTASGTTSWQYSGPLPAWGDGYYTVRARARDTAGHEATSQPVTAVIDLSAPPPPGNMVISPQGWTNRNAFTVTWTNPFDPAGIAGAWYSIGVKPTSASDGVFVAGNGIRALTGITVPVEGETPIYVWLQDGLGHADHTRVATVTARYDATPPLPPFGLEASPSGWQSTNDFTLTWNNPPDISGIAGVYYRFTSPPAHPTDGILVRGENISELQHIQVPGEGAFDVYIWLLDAAGNADHTRANSLPHAFRYDATPPSITPNVVGPLGGNGWYVGPVTVTLNAVDALSGVERVQYRLGTGDWVSGTLLALTADGLYTVTYEAVDRAGNWTPSTMVTIGVDTSPPVITYTIEPEPRSSGWYTDTVTVDVSVHDETSGVAQVAYRVDEGVWRSWNPGTSIRISDEGYHTLQLRARDKAGNEVQVGPLEFNIDRRPPVTAYLVKGDPGEDKWYVSPVTVTLTPTDTASGVVVTYYRIDNGPWQTGTEFVVEGDGKHRIEFYSVDAAGWQEQGFPTPLWIDTTPPPAPPLVRVSPNTWTNRNQFQVEWALPSDLSEVVGAYYKLDMPPTAPDDGTFISDPHASVQIRVPNEGAHTLYLWLRDGAGNADYEHPAVVEEALKYDITPPTTSPVLTGEKGANGWWRSAVLVTFRVTDTLSGPHSTYVAVDEDSWEMRSVVTVAPEGKHVVRFYSVDAAGNKEEEQAQPVRIDMHPPSVPDDLRIVTTGWQNENRFLVRWTPPLDASGIWGIRYTVGAPPSGPDDGTFVPGQDQAVIEAPSEGVHDVYIWLVDRAGNSDPASARYFPQALWYDATPPDLDVRVTGEEGENGWFVGPVTVSAAATDTVSGQVRVWATLDGSEPFTLTAPLLLEEEGRHRVRIWATDAAGNQTSVWEQEIAIDFTPPSARVHDLPPYMADYRTVEGDLVTFSVSWGGVDGSRGSGVVAYDVQVRDGFTGGWLLWQPRTQSTSAVFVGQVGHTYFFRVRAYDAAGHVSTYTTSPRGDTYTHLTPLRNGNFETGNFFYWNAARVPQPDLGGKGLKLTVKDANHYAGGTSLAAWLGDPEYGGAENPGLVPIGGAVISRTLTVPSLAQMSHPTLEFWYHMITWDVIYAPSHKRWQDTFEVRLKDKAGRLLEEPFRDGYWAQNEPPIKGIDYAVKHDLGWRRFRKDLTPYAGQTIVVEISTWNRWDNQYNTYTIVDDVRLVDPSITPAQYIPLVITRGNREHLQEETPEPIMPVLTPSEGGTRER